MSIKQWPISERPRERLIRLGAESLSNVELLAILIGTGSSHGGSTALDTARNLFERYTDFRSMAGATSGELETIHGIGPGKASRILAGLEMVRRIEEQKRKRGSPFKDSGDVFSSYSMKLRDERQEIFIVILLDTKNRFLSEKRISIGTLNQSIVHPRDVFHAAIRESAASVLLIHNHPSGDPTPSEEDRMLTYRMVQAGQLLGIRVLDHMIIGDGRYFSFCDEKCLVGTGAG
jgi:DNA repair protein RadC